MIHVFALFVIITASMFIVRAGGLALCRTGLSRESAMFQSQSAFMGVGFTTKEAENVVSHPVRRRIIRTLMLLGFVSVTSTVSTLVVTFAKADGDPWVEMALLVVVVSLMWTADRIPVVRRLIDKTVTRALEQSTTLELVDYEELLNLNKGYAVAQVVLEEGAWLAGRTLREMRLADEGLLVLNIERESGVTIATPSAETELHVGDRLLCYGRSDVLAGAGTRERNERGDRAHELAVRRHRVELVEERVQEQVAEATGDDAPD